MAKRPHDIDTFKEVYVIGNVLCQVQDGACLSPLTRSPLTHNLPNVQIQTYGGQHSNDVTTTTLLRQRLDKRQRRDEND